MRRTNLKKQLWWPCLVVLFLLAGCGQENLYQGLAERDANDILVALYEQGIDADKLQVEKAQDITYTVQVSKENIQKARKILRDNNLPKQRELGLQVCESKSTIPTREEERCRKLLRLTGQVINSLEEIPGVIDASVVLNIPEENRFATEDEVKKKATASAVIRAKKDAIGENVREVTIQRNISSSVEGLDPRDVAVIISYVEPLEAKINKGPQVASAVAPGSVPLNTIAGLTLHQDSMKRFKIYAVAMLVLLLGVSAALILNVIKLTKMRQELKVSRAQGVGEAAGSAATPLLEEGSQSPTSQLEAGKGENAETPSPQA